MSKLAIVQSLDAIVNSTPVTVKAATVKVEPGKKALAFDYSSLFASVGIAHAFNQTLVNQALSGRVYDQFAALLTSELGAPNITKKADFEVYSRLHISADKKPSGIGLKKAETIREALAMVRECMSLEKVKAPKWAAKKAADKTEPVPYAPSAELSQIAADIRALDTLDKKAANWLIDVIRAQLTA